MSREFWHEEVLNLDLPYVSDQLAYNTEFIDCFVEAIKKAKRNPFRPGWDLKYDLRGWCEYKFFSIHYPSLGIHPDMRLVYAFNRDHQSIYILAVGARNSKETRLKDSDKSIYFIASQSLLKTVAESWIEIKD